MSKWITDRAPTKYDTSRNLDFYVWTIRNNEVTMWSYDDIEYGEPWMPITLPDPYVKPKRFFRVTHSLEGKPVVMECETNTIWATAPTREAAERIAAIYEEVMP